MQQLFVIAVFTEEQPGLFGPILQDAKWLPSLKLLGQKNTKVSPLSLSKWKISVAVFSDMISPVAFSSWQHAAVVLTGGRNGMEPWSSSGEALSQLHAAALQHWLPPGNTVLQLQNHSRIHCREESPTWEVVFSTPDSMWQRSKQGFSSSTN